MSIGDKGRSQLTRGAESKLFSLCLSDTYKVKVTFGQVGVTDVKGSRLAAARHSSPP